MQILGYVKAQAKISPWAQMRKSLSNNKHQLYPSLFGVFFLNTIFLFHVSLILIHLKKRKKNSKEYLFHFQVRRFVLHLF